MSINTTDAVISKDGGLLAVTIHSLPRWLRVDQRVGVIDSALLIVTGLMILTDFPALFFHLVFVLLALGAFYWRVRPFAIRTIVWAGAASAEVVLAVATGRTQPGELIEIPLWITMLLLVFLISAQRSQAQTEITHLSLHDSLTRLPNRTLFVSRLHEALARTGRQDETYSVLNVDLDGFKGINDRFGHAAGDALLVEIASRLRSLVRSGDTVARLGGDEFGLILRETDLAAAAAAAERIVSTVQQPVSIDDHTVVITPSVGIAISTPCAPGGAGELLRHADAAMYRAKAVSATRRATTALSTAA